MYLSITWKPLPALVETGSATNCEANILKALNHLDTQPPPPQYFSGVLAGSRGGQEGWEERCGSWSRRGHFWRLGVGAVFYQVDWISTSALVCTSSTPGLRGFLCLLSPGISFMPMNLNPVHVQRLPDFQTQPEPLPAAVDSAYPPDHLIMPLAHLPRAELLVLYILSSPSHPYLG